MPPDDPDKEMTVTTRWWWIRHAPVHNPDRRIYGQDDLDADTSDTAAFKALAAALPRDAVWVTSALKRSLQTAAALAPHVRASGAVPPEPVIEPDLAEQNFGAWQGMTFDELKDHLGEGFDRVWQAPAHATPPQGENFADVIARVALATNKLTEAHTGRDIVAFAHGGSIRAALALALGLDADAALSFRIENLSLTRIDHINPRDEKAVPGAARPWRVSAVNISHG